MQHKPVKDALQAHFDLDARCVEFISRFLIALLKVRSVNLALLSHFCPVVRPCQKSPNQAVTSGTCGPARHRLILSQQIDMFSYLT